MGKKKNTEITIRSSAAEYLTFVTSTGDDQDSVEMRYEDENIWLTQKMMATRGSIPEIMPLSCSSVSVWGMVQ